MCRVFFEGSVENAAIPHRAPSTFPPNQTAVRNRSRQSSNVTVASMSGSAENAVGCSQQTPRAAVA